MGECWAAGTATLMILGDVCTRSCGFCHIATGRPPTLDLDEPVRVGDAVAHDEPRARRSSPASTATSCPTAAPPSGPRRSARSACNRPARASKCSSPTSAATGTRSQLVLDEQPGHPQPQHRVRPAPLQHRPPAGEVPPQPRAPADRQGPGLRHQDRHDARPRRRRARDRRRARRPRRDRLRHPHARPIPPADREASAGRALGPPRRIRRVEDPRRSPRPAPRRSRARWCAAATTPRSRSSWCKMHSANAGALSSSVPLRRDGGHTSR